MLFAALSGTLTALLQGAEPQAVSYLRMGRRGVWLSLPQKAQFLTCICHRDTRLHTAVLAFPDTRPLASSHLIHSPPLLYKKKPDWKFHISPSAMSLSEELMP